MMEEEQWGDGSVGGDGDGSSNADENILLKKYDDSEAVICSFILINENILLKQYDPDDDDTPPDCIPSWRDNP